MRALGEDIYQVGDFVFHFCRWQIDGIMVDIMPTDKRILGFNNRWYLSAMRHAVRTRRGSGVTIRTVMAPFFLIALCKANSSFAIFPGINPRCDPFLFCSGKKIWGEILRRLSSNFHQINQYDPV
ncbi:hypothetical protein GFER_00005 [Geoalkalibacter ferrihydriticus DSM 17813]|uniref:Uncharacterized protein n=1 Tax=Geoalkalibacter ferrihydriticus DSM 17813 TaxID=1121915 RepID=A0A0C2HQP5_9BACT|nr:hypothetical protein GFER_00005 [Geoalkalibacter ferrihydriticus DSM 17813]